MVDLESQDENQLVPKITSENSIEVDTNENHEEENVSLNDDSM